MIGGQVDKTSIVGAAALAIVGIVIGMRDASANGDLIYQATEISVDTSLMSLNPIAIICIVLTVGFVAMAMYSIRCMA